MRSDLCSLSTPRAAGALLVGAALLGLLASACADVRRGVPAPDPWEPPPDVPGIDGGTGEGVSFAAAVLPILVDRCQSCHMPGGAAGQTSFLVTGNADTDYEETIPLIDESAPAESRLLSKASGIGHGGGAIFRAGTAEYDTILSWILNGALP